MPDYKDIRIKHYGGGMSGSKLSAQGLDSKSGINDFLRAFESCEKIGYPLPKGITNYGIAELVYGAASASYNNGCNELSTRKNMSPLHQWNRYKRVDLKAIRR